MRKRSGKPGRFCTRNPDLQFLECSRDHVGVSLRNDVVVPSEVRSGVGQPGKLLRSKSMTIIRVLTIVAGVLAGSLGAQAAQRSEERRVGKECRSRWTPYQ